MNCGRKSCAGAILNQDDDRGPLGYVPSSDGLGIVRRRLHDELPGRRLLISGHGIGTDDDRWRTEILSQSLAEVADVISEGDAPAVCTRCFLVSVLA